MIALTLIRMTKSLNPDMSVYKTWVFYTLTYAQTVAASLSAKACRKLPNIKIQDPVAETTKEKIKTKHQVLH